MPGSSTSTFAAQRWVGGLSVALTLAVAVVGLGGPHASYQSASASGVVELGGQDGWREPPRSIGGGGGDAAGKWAAQPRRMGPYAGMAGEDRPSTHEVAPGETAGEIAERYGVGLAAFVRANGLLQPERLQPGDRLVVPDPDAAQPLTPEEATAADLDIEAVLEEAAEAFGWNPATVKAVAWVESRWNQRLVSNRGAIGVMQVQPATGALVESRVDRSLDLHDPLGNALAGVAYLDLLYEHKGGDVAAVLAAYHQGPEALRQHGAYPLSRWYVDEVLRLREVFRAL